MTRLVVCAALGIEARALRSGGGSQDHANTLGDQDAETQVVRVGMGTRRARNAAARLPGHDVLAVAGFGAGVDPGLRPGDLVVADEVRYDPMVVPCPWSAALAELLRRAGLPVVVGPVATVNHLAVRRRLSRMADAGVTAVDMESFPLVETTAGRPFAVLRVVVDTPGHPLVRAATVRSGIAARNRLRELGPLLRTWASTTAHPSPTHSA